jgi:membrane protein involved in colicin uptake
VANVTHPAYEQTSVGTREQSDRINAAIDEQLKRECGDDEAKRKAEEDAKAEEERKAKEEQERKEREAEEQAERFREQQAMRLRMKAHRINDEFLESLNY